MDELDLTEKTPRTFDEDDLHDEVSHLAAPVTPARTARGTSSTLAVPPAAARAGRSITAPPPLPRQPRRAPTVKPLVGTATVPPSKLIPFLPPPEPQSPVPGSFPVVRGPIAAAPPPVPAPRASTSPPPPAARRAPSVGPHVVPRTLTPAMQAPAQPSASLVGPAANLARSSAAMGAVDAPIDVAPFAADEPTEDVAARPNANADEVGDDELDRSSARPRRNVAVVAGVAVGAALVITTLGLVLGGSGSKPAPAPVSPALATAPAVHPATAPVAPAPPARPPAVEVAATTSTAAPAAAPMEPAEDEPPHVDLPITSQPDGAIVTLIANGDATVVGRTPITATVDPTLTYEVVLALRDHPTQITRIDASKVHALAIDLTPRPAQPPARRRAKVATATKPVATKPAAKPARRMR